jgi:hypothetical protein
LKKRDTGDFGLAGALEKRIELLSRETILQRYA